jgi:epoxyqueuosine reductase
MPPSRPVLWPVKGVESTDQIPMTNLESKIKQLGRSVGFDLVGITTAEPFLRDEQAALQRVRDGLMDGLAWYTEERVRKANRPSELLPGARSVVSLAVSYNTGSPTPSRQLTGKVARYAWGEDYHKVIKRRLKAFVAELPDLAGRPVATRVFVDDGPMNDRAAAERAGIGWFGKSTNVLTPSHGSWVFLSQVVTDIDLRPDAPLKKTCGSCTACIDDCPTGAIVAPYVVDNTKCISFLTIELRGAIPKAMRPQIGDWVFGCDICQDVCPVNRKAVGVLEPQFTQRHDFAAPALLPLLELTDEAFIERFRGSPIRRAKRVGLQRNVCVALGNIGDPSAVPALARVLRHAEEPMLRGHAAWALGRIGGPVAERALQDAASGERDPEARAEIEEAQK